MRKVTERTARAFLAGDTCCIGNTHTDGTALWLHGNKIAEKVTESKLRVSLAGWNTPTTRERLNGILDVFGIPHRIRQHNFEPCIYDSVTNKPVYFDADEWLDFTF